jgi:butyryl-CoA dehydrogenase
MMMMISRFVSRRTRTVAAAQAHAQAQGRRSITCHSQLSEETTMVYEMCRKFADEELAPNAREWDQKHIFPTTAISALSELGLMGINTPEDNGGSGLDSLSYAIAMEEISRGCASTGVIMSAHNSLYMYPVQTFGTPAQHDQWITPFAFPSTTSTDDNKKINNIGCFCLSEPGNGSDAGAATTTAIKDGDDWIINGTKAWITNAYEADAAIVFATTDKSLK